MDFFEKIDTKPTGDFEWNVPEQKLGHVAVVGGSKQNFRTEIKVSEFLSKQYPIKIVQVVLPDALEKSLPPLPNFIFLRSTESGSFADGKELEKTFEASDFNLLIGDLSKNSITSKAMTDACSSAKKPLLITRDAIDLVIENHPERLLMNEQIIFLASMPQLQKIFRAVYYPKMLLLSQSLIQVADALHKFTLSYPISVITLQGGQVLIAKSGTVKSIPLERTGYSPLMFWGGEIAAKIAALNLYNPSNFINASVSAIWK